MKMKIGKAASWLKLTLGIKLGIAFSAVAAIAVALGGFSLWEMSRAQKTEDILANETVPEVEMAAVTVAEAMGRPVRAFPGFANEPSVQVFFR